MDIKAGEMPVDSGANLDSSTLHPATEHHPRIPVTG
jgi:hypothetical protein